MNIEDFQRLVMEKATKEGFADGEVYYEAGESFEVLALEGALSHYENSSQSGLSFRGTWNGKMGYAFTQRYDEEAAEFLIAAAKENAEIIEEAEKEELFEGEREYPQIEGYSEKLAELTPEEKIQSVFQMEKAAHSLPEIQTVDYCLVGYGSGETAIANTKGMKLRYQSNCATAYASAVAQRDGDIQSGAEYWVGQNWLDYNPQRVGEKAAETAVKKLGAKTVPSGKYKIVMKNEAMSDLLGVFSGVFFGENVQKGFSLLKGRIGEKIAADIITIRDDGLYPGGLASVPFDSEGVKSANKAVVENGILKTFLYNLKSAKKDKVSSTGNGFRPSYQSSVTTACTNFYIMPGALSLDKLFEQVGKGVYITELAGLHAGANAISGDFSLSAQGFLIENGRLTSPVEQITIAANFYDILKSAVAVADDLRFGMPGGNGVIGSPSLAVEGVTIAGE